MTEKRFHPFAVLHLLRKTILVYLLPLVQVLFARNWAALWAALAQDVLLLALLSMVCWAVLRVSGWQMDAHGNLLVRWRLGIRLDRTLRADMLAALTIDRPVVYRLAGASRLTLYPAGQKKPLTLIVAWDDARELADRLLPLEQPVVHRPHGGEKMVFAVLGANGLSTLGAAGSGTAPEPPLRPGRRDPRLCTPESSGGLCGPLAAHGHGLDAGGHRVAVLHQSGPQCGAGGPLHGLAYRCPAGQPGRPAAPV